MAQVTIKSNLCKKCGYCIAFCPKKVFDKELDGAPKVVNPEACIKCMMCVKRCPDFAIEVEG